MQAPDTVANSALGFTPQLDWISPEPFVLDFVTQSSQSPADSAHLAAPPSLGSNPPVEASQTASPDPSEAASFNFNWPLEQSQSPPTTAVSDSPATNISGSRHPSPSGLTCLHCHITAPDVRALASHIAVNHSSPGRYFCGRTGCSEHTLERSLERHLRASPHHLGALYVCRCGLKQRKDKHQPHLQRCSNKGTSPYICICGNQVDSRSSSGLQTHQHHIKDCGKQRRGRPPGRETRQRRRQ